MMGKNGFHIRIQQEKSYLNNESLFSGIFFLQASVIASRYLPFAAGRPSGYVLLLCVAYVVPGVVC